MMRCSSLLFLLFLQTALFSQDGQIWLGFNYTPQVTTYEQGSELADRFSHVYGLALEIDLGDRYGLETGLEYGDFRLATAQETLRFGNQSDGEGGFDPTIPSNEVISGASTQWAVRKIGIPLVFGYDLINQGNVLLTISAGPSFEHTVELLQKQVLNDDTGATVLTQVIDRSPNRRLGVGLRGGIRLSINGPNWGLLLEPQFRQHWQSIEAANRIDSRWFSFQSIGLALGVRKRL